MIKSLFAPRASLTHFYTRIRQQDALLIYSSGSFVHNLVSLVASILVLRWVPPEQMGIWQTVMLVNTYGDIAKLGIFSGLNRELPFWLGKGDKEKAYQLAASAQAFSFIISCFGLLVFIGVALLGEGLSQVWRSSFFAIGLLWFASVYNSYLQVTFRTGNEFKALGYANYFHSFVSILTLALVAVWGYQGMIARAVFLAAVLAVIFHWLRPIRVGWRFNLPELKELMQVGIPIYISTYLYTLAMGLDRVVLLQKGGVEQVGYYAPATAVLTIMMTIPFSLTSYFNPRMVYSLGKNGDRRKLWRPTLVAVGLSFLTSFPMALLGWFLVPPALQYLFPQYLPGALAVQITLVAGVFLSLRTAVVALIVLKAWRYLYGYMILFITIRWSMMLLFNDVFSPLIAVAMGSIISFAIMAIIGLLASYRATHTLEVY